MKVLYLFLLTAILLFGCSASMDLRLDTLKSSPDYGNIQPRIELKDFKYYTGKPGKEYQELAKLIVQETPQVVMARTTDEMIYYLCETAWENGADALIDVEISTTNVAGGYARTSSVVKGTAVRFK
jgi:hypothetical protein